MKQKETEKILDLIKNGYCEVLGAGVSNIPLIKWLSARGARITVRDQKEREKIKGFDGIEDLGVALVCGKGYLEGLKSLEAPEKTLIFRSPGMRPDIDEIDAAIKAGATLTSEMELFFRITKANIIAVTGSDGKTTTTTLIGKILEESKKGRVFVGGNIGRPLLPDNDIMTEEDFAVIELSSFQLQTVKTSAPVAVITNITPNHLNWHTGMEEYTEAKYNVMRHGECKRLILNSDNELSRNAASELKNSANLVFFSLIENSYEKVVPVGIKNATAIYERNGIIYFSDGKEENELMRSSDIKVPGRHNVANYMAAFGATEQYVSPECVKRVATTFGGVEHRIELVRELRGVRYYNSSIDSTPTRTAAALSAFDKKVIAICGGYDKNIPFEPLAVTLCERAKAVVLTGVCADKILSALESYEGYKSSKLEVYKEPDFYDAVRKTRLIAKEGDVVILSPACASFDAFDNFAERGEAFKKTVNSF